MNHTDQIDAFYIELTNLVNRFRSEFDISVASAIGVLEMAKLDIYQQDVIEAEAFGDEDTDSEL